MGNKSRRQRRKSTSSFGIVVCGSYQVLVIGIAAHKEIRREQLRHCVGNRDRTRVCFENLAFEILRVRFLRRGGERAGNVFWSPVTKSLYPSLATTVNTLT